MKKIFSMVATCGLFMMTACSSNDEQAVQGPSTETGALTIEVQAETPAIDKRVPLYSQDPVLLIGSVDVYAFKDDGSGNFLYEKTFSMGEWALDMTFKRLDVDEADALPTGNYKFLAVGNNFVNTYTFTSLTSSTKFEDMQASVAQTGNEYDIYAGNASANITGDGARISITIKRKVAGILGYFKNVPQSIEGTTVTHLRLTVNTTSLAVNLTTGEGAMGTGTAYNIIDIDLTGQTVDNGVYTGNDLSANGVIKLPNTQLSGMYILPVNSVSLTLGLYDAGGNALKTWNIRNAGSTSFPLVANNFYALGQKLKSGNTDNGTPETPDDDNPIDLLTNQEISVTIIPAWDVINNLTIE